MQQHYWFRPKRFWGCFAAYYPVSREGWALSGIFLLAAVWIVVITDRLAHSASGMFIMAAPLLCVMLAIFDALCLRTGEYPSWWRRRGEHGTHRG